jgi:hypothetical protein
MYVIQLPGVPLFPIAIKNVNPNGVVRGGGSKEFILKESLQLQFYTNFLQNVGLLGNFVYTDNYMYHVFSTLFGCTIEKTNFTTNQHVEVIVHARESHIQKIISR